MLHPLAMDATPRMLVLDDEEPIRFALQEYFRDRGFVVDCAQELEEAEALINAVPYAVIIADLRLTGIHGSEGLSLVRYARQRCLPTPIILLTAYGTSEIERLAYAAGAAAFLHKPTPLAAISRLVAQLLEARLGEAAQC